MSDTLPISHKRKLIIERMDASAKRAGLNNNQVLTAVSKMQPDFKIKEIISAGQKVFGENRVQESQIRWGKTFKYIRKDVELRLIGPLQSNKALDAVKLFDVIETLDRMSLAKALVRAADKHGSLPKLLVQVNTGEEKQKSGVSPSRLPLFLSELKKEYNINPAGLMCIPPLKEAASPHFWFLKKLTEDYGMEATSMGMSNDFEVAIEMGATHVRVGSALFGTRI
jgi:pyridoxal phosphate enzyme (YggS family)